MRDHPEYQYLNLLKDIMKNGVDKPVFNNEVTCRSVFGRQIRFDLSQGFPLLTTKKVFLKGVIYELLWFLQGNSNIKYLVDNGVHIWDDWAYKPYKNEISIRQPADKNQKQGERKSPPVIARSTFDKLSATKQSQTDGKILSQEEFITKIKEDKDFASKWGELGPVYGSQWRKWKASDGRVIDQIKWIVEKIKKTPYRRHALVSAWNPEFIYEMAAPGKSMALPPCHTIWQLNVINNKLSLQLYHRSADIFLGVPFNIASYALLTMMLAQVTGLEAGEFVHTFGDVHIYSNHFDQVKEQLKRKPRTFPVMKINPEVKNIDDFKYEDFTLENYDPYPPIKGEVTVVGGF